MGDLEVSPKAFLEHLTGVYLIGVCLMGVYLTGVHLMGIHFMGMHLIGVQLQNSILRTVTIEVNGTLQSII